MYYINSVDSKETSLAKKKTIMELQKSPQDVEVIEGFIDMDEEKLKKFLEDEVYHLI